MSLDLNTPIEELPEGNYKFILYGTNGEKLTVIYKEWYKR